MFKVSTFFPPLKTEIFSLIKSDYFSHQNLRSHENHIKYLENFLDILHSPLEFSLSPLCALGGRAQINSIIRVDLACGFQQIQLLGGASSDQKVTGGMHRVFILLALCLPCWSFLSQATKVSVNTLLWTP